MASTIATNPREVVERRLIKDLGRATEAHITAGVLCGEMGCGEMMEFIDRHPDLSCPYGGMRDGKEKCDRLKAEYRSAITRRSAT